MTKPTDSQLQQQQHFVPLLLPLVVPYISLLVWLPCPVTTGKGLGLGVLISNLGGSRPSTRFAAFPAERSAEMSLNLPNFSPTLTTSPIFLP